MKRLFATLVILTCAGAVNAQQTNFSLSKQPATIKHFVCSCSTNYTASLLKSKANADWFQKMTKLSVDTDRTKSQRSDTTYERSGYIVYENFSLNQLLNTTAAANLDRMPIAQPANTDKRMPIVKTDKTAYNMPIVGKKSKPQIILEYKTKSGADSLVYIK
jgi:hypothetical protein